MGWFRKKPRVVEAFRLPLRGEEPSEALLDFLNSMEREWESGRDETIVIHTLEGTMEGLPGDWIIKGLHGEFYPCKPEIFDETYEVADAPDQP